MFNTQNIVMEVSLWISAHTHATEKRVFCTEIVCALNSIIEDPNSCYYFDSLEKTAEKIIKMHDSKISFDDFVSFSEKYISYDDVLDFSELYENGDITTAKQFLQNALQKTKEKHEERETSFNDCYSLVGGRKTAINMLEAACQAVGFDTLQAIGDDHHEGEFDTDKISLILTNKYQNEFWFVK